jgi:hypothetical protein
VADASKKDGNKSAEDKVKEKVEKITKATEKAEKDEKKKADDKK